MDKSQLPGASQEIGVTANASSSCKASRYFLVGLFVCLAGAGFALTVIGSQFAGLGCPIYLLCCAGLALGMNWFPGLVRYLLPLCILSSFLLICLLLSLGIYAVLLGETWVYVLIGYCIALVLVFVWGSYLFHKFLKEIKQAQAVRTYDHRPNIV